MTLVAAAATALAAAVAAPARRDASRRLAAAGLARPARTRRGGSHGPVVAAMALLTLPVLGSAWPLAVVPAAILVLRRRSRRPPGPPPAQVALVADLLACALAAGALPPGALRVAAEGCSQPLRSACRATGDALADGGAPERAWATWLADPVLAAVARPCVRAAGSGAAAADELGRVAARIRARRRAEAARRVQRASVWVVLPLGVCFLPAFVLVAVVPLVAGLVPSLR